MPLFTLRRIRLHIFCMYLQILLYSGVRVIVIIRDCEALQQTITPPALPTIAPNIHRVLYSVNLISQNIAPETIPQGHESTMLSRC